MESPFTEDKSSQRFSSLSFITFNEDDWKLLSPSLTTVEKDICSTEGSILNAGTKRPEVFRSLWHEVGFVFSMAMSQILTVPTSKKAFLLCRTNDKRSTLYRDSQLFYLASFEGI